MTKLFATKGGTQLLRNAGIKTWEEALVYVADLPYGRNANRDDLGLVIKERKGTCSSKHAFLAQVAGENNLSDVTLILGMYKMTKENTPGIGNIITEHNLSYIPEAHCYLKIHGVRRDITTAQSSFDRIENAIISETEISPPQVSEWKVHFHKQFIQDWLISEEIKTPFTTIWWLREQCIASLSKQ